MSSQATLGREALSKLGHGKIEDEEEQKQASSDSEEEKKEEEKKEEEKKEEEKKEEVKTEWKHDLDYIALQCEVNNQDLDRNFMIIHHFLSNHGWTLPVMILYLAPFKFLIGGSGLQTDSYGCFL